MLRSVTEPVSILAVVLVELMAGLLVGTAIEQKTLEVLAAGPWITARHGPDAVFSRVLPWWWNGLLLLAGIVVTVAVEVPMNKQVVQWQPGAMPAEWMAVRDRWLRFHAVRTVLGVLSFGCAVGGLVR